MIHPIHGIQTGHQKTMARSVRKAGLETRTARLKLPVARKPMFIRIGPGLSLGYRRNQVAGTWVLRIADGNSPVTMSVFDQGISGAMMTSIAVSPSMAKMTATFSVESD
jgi:hypothetical protein